MRPMCPALVKRRQDPLAGTGLQVWAEVLVGCPNELTQVGPEWAGHPTLEGESESLFARAISDRDWQSRDDVPQHLLAGGPAWLFDTNSEDPLNHDMIHERDSNFE